MYKEKHILNHHTAGHKLSRYLDVYETTLQTDGHGTISASNLTGYAGDNITLSATPNKYYALDNYTLTGANITGDTYKLVNSDVTAQANFIMTGVPVNVICSGKNINFEMSINFWSGHTYFVESPATVSRITDPYVVLQYDYKASYAGTYYGSATVDFNFNYTGASRPAYSMSYNDAYTNTSFGTPDRSVLLWCRNEQSNTRVHPNSAVASRGYFLDNTTYLQANNRRLSNTEHHYKIIAKTDGSNLSAYVDGVYYGDIENAHDPAYCNTLLVSVTGVTFTGYLHNLSYVSTSSWADAIAFNG